MYHDGTLLSLCFQHTLGLSPSRRLTIPSTGLHPFHFSVFKLSPRLHVQSPPCSMTVIMMVTVYVSLSPYTSLGGGTVILLYGWWCKTSKGPPPGQTNKWLGQDSVLRLPTRCDPLTHRNCEHFSQKWSFHPWTPTQNTHWTLSNSHTHERNNRIL